MTQPPLCYPHAAGTHLTRPTRRGIHTTDGLPGNYALDFMAPGGTPVLAPQGGTITRVSGHPTGAYVPGSSIFGRSVYLQTTGGVVYFCTHLDDLIRVRPGDKVKIGHHLGNVGHWPHNPGRSHTHLGVTHPMGKVAAVARIVAVAKALRRTTAGWPPL